MIRCAVEDAATGPPICLLPSQHLLQDANYGKDLWVEILRGPNHRDHAAGDTPHDSLTACAYRKKMSKLTCSSGVLGDLLSGRNYL